MVGEVLNVELIALITSMMQGCKALDYSMAMRCFKPYDAKPWGPYGIIHGFF